MPRAVPGLKKQRDIDRRQQLVAIYQSRGCTVDEIHQLIVKVDPVTGNALIDPSTKKTIPAWSRRTIENDTVANKSRYRDQVGSLTAQDLAAEIRRDEMIWRREISQALADVAKMEKPRDRVRSRVVIVREWRAITRDVCDRFQSLGIIYKAPIQVRLREQFWQEMEGVPMPVLARIAEAQGDEAFKQALADAFGEERAQRFLASPAGQEAIPDGEWSPMPDAPAEAIIAGTPLPTDTEETDDG